MPSPHHFLKSFMDIHAHLKYDHVLLEGPEPRQNCWRKGEGSGWFSIKDWRALRGGHCQRTTAFALIAVYGGVGTCVSTHPSPLTRQPLQAALGGTWWGDWRGLN